MKLPEQLKQVMLSVMTPAMIAVEVTPDTPGFIIKDERRNLRNVKGQGVPIAYQPQLGLYETGAIFRMYIELRGGDTYKGESFLNPAEPTDLNLLHLFCTSSQISFIFVDTQALVIDAKAIRNGEQTKEDLRGMIGRALMFNEALGELNYPESRMRMMRETRV